MRIIPMILTFVALASAASLRLSNPNNTDKKRYDNFSVYKIALNSEKQRDLLEKLINDGENFNLWHNDGNEAHLMISPNVLSYFKSFTLSNGMKTELFIPNVQSLIDAEQVSDKLDSGVTLDWTRYYPLSSIEAWLDEILAKYPQITEGFVIGKSYEGRSIRGIKISYKSNNPGIFIESNIHAREWITSATATWLINELLTSNQTEVRQLAEQHDWYVVPVLNVDGFAYTHEKDRLWRKTRQPVPHFSCIGADPNRNFDTHWLENGVGASDDPCSANYAGSHAFSEPEVKALADYIASIKQNLNIVISFHSYSQLMLSPYGHSTEELPPNNDDLIQVGKAYADGVASLPYGTKYVYGPSASTIYVTTGATPDWVYNTQGIKLAYTIEFRDTGRFGHVLPPVQIIPNGEETLAGLLGVVKKAKELDYLEVK